MSRLTKNWINDPANLMIELYSRMNQRLERKGQTKTSFTKNTFMRWVYTQTDYYTLYLKWEKSGFNWNSRPTVDRIDSTKTYTLRNMQILSWKDNKHKETWDVITSPRKDNKSGYTGVWENMKSAPTSKRWMAMIKIGGKNVTKSFHLKTEAIAHRVAWERKYYGNS